MEDTRTAVRDGSAEGGDNRMTSWDGVVNSILETLDSIQKDAQAALVVTADTEQRLPVMQSQVVSLIKDMNNLRGSYMVSRSRCIVSNSDSP